ncbi:Zona pellucida sperm-binding protein 4 [Acipenser ruthenus]|uniref:Zona pellucida sperm-binding protein 4 n=1 Tax=Acipenser ruthenus TaxID=7906 RepID=A0A444U5K6_ACIRT|nr:Zona pellucida sperm-binding protein 4 [Acipenser ruthenus]
MSTLASEVWSQLSPDPDGTRVADQSLIWSVPLQYPALVAYPDSFKTISVTMGANGVLLDPETLSRSPYKLITNETHITIEVPVGAEGGYIQLFIFFPQDYHLRIIVTASEDTLPITDLGKTTLKDENCTPVEYNETFAIFNFQLDSCGTTGRFEDNYVIYENEIHNKKKILRSDVAVITSDPLYRLTVLCKYRRNSTIQQYIPAYGSIVAPRLPSNGGPRAKRSRQILDIRVRLSRDMKYTHFYTDEEYPFEKNLKDPLFFEVALKQENTSVELSLETCWLSNSTGFDSKRKWSIYENGCEVQSTEYLTIAHPVSTAQVKRFEVLLFASADGTLKGPVYLHCMVMVCDARIYKGSSALCMKQCEMGHKLASYESRQYFNLQGYVSTGPVLLTQPTASAPERSITEQGKDKQTLVLVMTPVASGYG